MQYPDVDVIWESEDGAERIVLAYEEGPSAPCNDGGTPILAIYPWGEVGQITEITSYVVDDDIISALRRCHELHDGQDLFERYLRIFHGLRPSSGTSTATSTSRSTPPTGATRWA